MKPGDHQNCHTAPPRRKAPRGIAALLTIVIVGATALILALGASLLGLGELDLGYTAQRGGRALAVADGCLEEALRRFRLDSTYGLSGAITAASCTIEVVDLGSGQRRVMATGRSDNYVKRVRAEVVVAPQAVGTRNTLTITLWEELGL